MTLMPDAIEGGKRDERSDSLIVKAENTRKMRRDMLSIFQDGFPGGVYSTQKANALLPVTIWATLAGSKNSISFLVYDKASEKPIGACLGFLNDVNFEGAKENVTVIDVIAARPGTMAGVAIMREIFEIMNTYREPVEFIASELTTAKILKRRTAREALRSSGWVLTEYPHPEYRDNEEGSGVSRLEPIAIPSSL